jgi:hypothetical protein
VTVARRYYACGQCGVSRVPWDLWAGVDHRHLSPDARRMLTLAGMTWPFDLAAKRLKELCHLQTSDDTIERVCQDEGTRAQQFMKQSPAPAAQFAAAAGEVEFYTDGVQVNTVNGWREMRLSVFAKRPAAAPTDPAGWKKRVLPEPTARVAICAIGPSYRISASWKTMLGQLGIEAGTPMSVLGDGARWIWDEAAKRFKWIVNMDWCVDVFHISEHIHACSKTMFGEGAVAKRWADEHLLRLIEMEGPAFVESLKQERERLGEAEAQKAVEKLCGYLEGNRDSLWYRTRLAAGRPIGSGLIEGACKTAIAARLKVNSTRWRVRRVERMGALRCLDYSAMWEPFWQKTAA